MRMVHGEKFFTIEENQVIWDAYINNIMNTWDVENKERLEAMTFSDEEKSISHFFSKFSKENALFDFPL